MKSTAYKTGYIQAVEDVCKWLEQNADWNQEWVEAGRNPNYGKIEELKSDLLVKLFMI